MKKYIEPKNRCIEIDLESLIAYSQQGGMRSGEGVNNTLNNGPQLVKEQESFGSHNLWDNEW